MVVCKACDTPNSVDSRFCKGCGAIISDEALQEARSKLEELVAEGFKSFGAGQSDEARLIAESALASDPSCISAMSLRAMCFERDGKIAEALDLYEKILEAKPDSALDRIKVTHLRQALAGSLLEHAPADKRTAWLGAIAATVLVAAIGVAAAGFMSGPDARAAANTAPSGSGGLTPSLDRYGALLPETSPNSGASSSRQTESGQQPNGGRQQQPADSPRAIQPDRPAIRPNGSLGPIPATTGTSPLFPSITGEIGIRPEGGAAPNAGTQAGPPAPAKTKLEESPDPDVEPPPGKASETGVINIKVSKPPENRGGTVEVPDGKEAESLTRAARQQFQLGKYANAAKLYEQALKAGADPGYSNQRLGFCYERLGNSESAKTAYGRAISAFEAALRSGAGNKDSLESALESCRAAQRRLQGGP